MSRLVYPPAKWLCYTMALFLLAVCGLSILDGLWVQTMANLVLSAAGFWSAHTMELPPRPRRRRDLLDF